MHRAKKNQDTKAEAFELFLEFLRYALANKIHPLRVIQSEPVSSPWSGTGVSFTRVLIEIDGIPVMERENGLPISRRRVTEFFESWELQEHFLRWLGQQIAKVTPRSTGGAKLKKRFAHLTVGRMGKLPPRIFLRAQYNQLVWEIKSMQSQFQASAVPTDEQREAILEFGRKTSAHWILYVGGELDLNEIILENPGSAAELILGEQYGCSDANIRSWLSRRG
jgi:hypothetical protein